jgi:hypothetical protein
VRGGGVVRQMAGEKQRGTKDRLADLVSFFLSQHSGRSGGVKRSGNPGG